VWVGVAKRLSRSRKKGSSKKALRRGLKLVLKVFCLLLIFTVLQVLILKMVDPPMTTRMAYQWVKIKLGTEDGPMPRYQWRPLNKISVHLVRAVLAGEDQRFLSHHGFDFIEMNEALQDMVAGERLRGASTISMQTARTVFLWQDRSWLRKSLEAYYTVLIELVWGKRRILEIYLNTVDWGNDMVGAGAAAGGYFRKTAAALNPEEGALLAAILPSPHHWSPAQPSPYVRERQRKILRDMNDMRVP
jgi:monofunctional biosynthetic peptidoglycan transglycosylase